MDVVSEFQDQTDATLPPVTEAVILELANLPRPDTKPALPSHSSFSDEDARLRSGVDRTISLIRSGGSKLEQIIEKARLQDDIIRQLRDELAQTKSRFASDGQRAAKRLQDETDRAQRAEASAKALDMQIKQFEAREKIASANLERVMKIVDETFAKAERVQAEAAGRQVA